MRVFCDRSACSLPLSIPIIIKTCSIFSSLRYFLKSLEFKVTIANYMFWISECSLLIFNLEIASFADVVLTG